MLNLIYLSNLSLDDFATIVDMQIYAISATVLISIVPILVTLAGYTHLNRKWFFNLLLAIAAGSLLGEVWLHSVPELFSEAGENINYFSIIILGGILLFFVYEATLHTYLHKREKQDWALASVNILTDALHNFIDGILIAAAFLISVPVGLAATAAIVLHEIPQEIGDLAILKMAGLKQKAILIWNFVSGLLAVAGVLLGLVLGGNESGAAVLMAFTTGGFLYLSLVDLLPEIKHQHNWRTLILQFIGVLIGVGSMYLLTFIGE